jgi:hypothetical protein
VPRFVYATRADFDSLGAPSPQILERIEQLAKATAGMARALEWLKTEGAAKSPATP